MSPFSKSLDSKFLSPHGLLMRNKRSQWHPSSIVDNSQEVTPLFALAMMAAQAPLSSNPSNSMFLIPPGLQKRIEEKFRPQLSNQANSQVEILPLALETAQQAPINALLPRTKLTLSKLLTNQASKLILPLRQLERSLIPKVLFLLAADLTSPSDDANCSVSHCIE